MGLYYVVMDYSGELVRGRLNDEGEWTTEDCPATPERTPCAEQAMRWETRQGAETACWRATDRVLEWED